VGKKTRGNMPAIKGRRNLCSLHMVLPGLDPRAKLRGMQEQLKQSFALTSHSLNPPESRLRLIFFSLGTAEILHSSPSSP